MLYLFTAVISGVLFVLFSVLVSVEERRQQRLLLGTWRTRFDSAMLSLSTKLAQCVRHVVRNVITLSWYYSLHAFLLLVLRFIAGVYSAIEAVVIRNRNRAKQIRRERRQSGHLSVLADHKSISELSPHQKKKLKDKNLKGL